MTTTMEEGVRAAAVAGQRRDLHSVECVEMEGESVAIRE